MNDPGDPIPTDPVRRKPGLADLFGQVDPTGISTYKAALEFGISPLDIGAPDVERLLAEHRHAADKHGYAHLLTNPNLWEIDKLSALMEEVGEVAQLLTYDKRPVLIPNNTKEHPNRHDSDHRGCAACRINDENVRSWQRKLAKELLQVANLALAWHHSVFNGGN